MPSKALTDVAAARVLAVSAAVSATRPTPHVSRVSSSHPIPGGTVWVGAEQRAVAGSDPKSAAAVVIPLSLRSDDPVDLPAPSAAVVVDANGLVAATDHLGLHHVYGTRQSGWAAVSTSPSMLGSIAGAELDREALGAVALVGHFLGCDTPFRGVTKLPAGGRWHLADGELVLSTSASGEGPFVPDEDPVGYAAQFLRSTLERYLDVHPDLVLELSGGLDSRLLLAAVPPTRRAGLTAITSRSSHSKDDEVAAAIANLYGLRRHVVDLSGLDRLDPTEAHALVTAAAARHGGIGNPVELGVLAWAEAQYPQQPRVNGQGGEYARGFYYAGQLDRAAADPRLIRRLAAWRLFVNDRVDDAALDPTFAAETRSSTLRRLEQIFAGYGDRWLQSCDEFYLHERMHRWVGIDVTVSGTDRVVLSPYFEPAFLAIARALDPRLKRGSRFTSQVLARLDPELAAIPLDSGTTPAQQVQSNATNTVRALSTTTRKLAARVAARTIGSGRQPIGAPVLAELLGQHWRAQPELLASARKSGLLRESWIDGFLAGTTRMSPPTAAFVANIAHLTAAGVAG